MTNTPKTYLNDSDRTERTLVVIFLRGGADGLSLVPPIGDDGYHNARSRIAVGEKEAFPLDGFFGLHPRMPELKPIYDAGELLVVHATGSEDSTRSHFEAQDLMEHGGQVAGGWLGRFLRYRAHPADGALATVAIGKTLPEALRGAPSATAIESLDEFGFANSDGIFMRELSRLYERESGELGRTARDTLGAMERMQNLRANSYVPDRDANYPNNDFGRGLLQIVRLIKGRVGLESATLDLGGWDSHLTQETLMNPLMTTLSIGLGAFHRDLGREMDRTTVVVMTEFGRRVRENSAFGTDHGRGSVMFVLGGGIRGGRVHADWKGLQDEVLEGPGDLPVTTNYRDVLAAVLSKHDEGADLKRIFPDYEVRPLHVYA
jgi:uncharacterized protein (DUF1501 family)